MDRVEKAFENVIEELTGILKERTVERIRVHASEDSYDGGEKSITVTVEYFPKEDRDESSTDNEIFVNKCEKLRGYNLN